LYDGLGVGMWELRTQPEVGWRLCRQVAPVTCTPASPTFSRALRGPLSENNYDDWCLPACDDVWSSWSLPTFRRTMLPHTSGCKSRQRKSTAKLCYDLRSAGQSALVSSPIWGPRSDFCYSQITAGSFMWGALSDERMGLSFTITAGPRRRSHSRVSVPRDSWPYFTVSDSRLPQPGGQGPVFISPRNRVTQLYPQALGSIFVASYDSQGCGRGIRTRLCRANLPSRSKTEKFCWFMGRGYRRWGPGRTNTNKDGGV
jgi:hypothetical protein